MARPGVEASTAEVEPNFDILKLPVSQLFASNPQCAVHNQASLEDMSAHFSPKRYDAIHVAQVLDQGMPVWLVVDGNTRLYYAHKNGLFNLDCKDITQDLLLNPKIVTDSRKTAGRKSLSQEEYLRAVIEPTKVHGEIAPTRIASHMIRGWEGLVGEDLASKVGATSVFRFLADESLQDIPNNKLMQILRRQEILFEGEDVNSRRKVESAIVTTHQILAESGVGPLTAYRNALNVLVTPNISGGDQNAAREIYALLNSQVINEELSRMHPDNQLRQEQERNNLSLVVIEAMRRLKSDEQELDIISDVMFDPLLNISEKREVLSGTNIRSSFEAARQLVNEYILWQQCDAVVRENEHREYDGLNIRGFCKPFMSEREISEIAKIYSDNVAFREKIVEAYCDFENEKVRLTNAGADESSIEVLWSILNKNKLNIDRVFSKQHPWRTADLRGHLGNMYQEAYTDYKHKLEMTYNGLEADKIVESYAGQYDPSSKRLLRQSVYHYINVNHPSSPEDTEALMSSLLGLEPKDLRAAARGNINIGELVVFHKLKSKKGPIQNGEEPIKPIDKIAEAKKAVTTPDKYLADTQNRLLAHRVKALNELLSSIKLSSETLTPENERLIWETVNMLVALTGTHPDAQRVLKTDYPSLLKKVEELQARLTLV